MKAPQITTALPKRRYQLGDFGITVLGDVQSSDGNEYRYVFAMVPDGRSDPYLYISAIKAQGDAYTLHLSAPNMERDLDTSAAWRDLDHFCDQSISIAQQILGLKDEFPQRIM